ncbi:PAS/PAC sensor hybrid histidine kinase [Caballeronia arvi]|uniref:histidine kinase n=1 Tax=Caballeronia arvi TaxID=1777135 RepID=A0A158L559_9BURK|nr:ATP-binding protein [Caballeronia arvi]SAL88496.1 PAS/PAC sensor hybrid histidine kinase [Caballeronia arvi]
MIFKTPHTMALQRYDILDRVSGGFVFRYWSPVNAPVIAPDGRLLYIVHRVENVTDYVKSLEANEALRDLSRLLEARLSRSEAEVLRNSAALNATTHALQRLTEDARSWRVGEEKFRLVTDALPQIVWTALEDGHVNYRNQHFYEFTGASRIPGKNDDWVQFVHPDDRASVKEVWSRSVATGEPYEAVFRVRHQSGEYRWTLARALPVRGESSTMLTWVGTNTDIHEKVLAEQQLRDAHRRKDEFLAMLAHELRNPLAPIRAGAELLSQLSLDKERVSRVGVIIRRQVVHMTGLIDDLLDVSRVTRGRILLNKRNLDLKQVVRDSVEQVRPLFEAHGHRFTVEIPDETVCVYGDHKRLVQVMSNLLNNAAKYTPDGGLIALTVAATSEEVVAGVKDNGIGMEPELLRTAFDLFRQGSKSVGGAEGGLGLGLALVKSMVEQHGGNVAARSEGLGKGSLITVRLPRMHCDLAGAPAHEELGQPAVERRRLRVLLVDDNVDVAESMGLVLEILGNEVVVAHDAAGALTPAHQQTFDICMLDIGLPGVDGFELAHRLRILPGCNGAILVAHTGYGQDEDRRKSAEAGFAYHLVKPVSVHDLQNVLDHAARDW